VAKLGTGTIPHDIQTRTEGYQVDSSPLAAFVDDPASPELSASDGNLR
jgi:hypothetical protein